MQKSLGQYWVGALGSRIQSVMKTLSGRLEIGHGEPVNGVSTRVSRPVVELETAL